MKKTIVSLFCTFAILFGCMSILFQFISFAAAANKSNIFIEESELPLKLWYDEPAPITSTEHSHYAHSNGGADEAWERWSLPIGNAYFGANVFGRTETERIQITEKTLSNPFSYSPNSGGLNNFSETFIDFNHTTGAVTDYIRYLDLKTAVSGVDYTYNGVKYTREYFISYPDKALVIKLDADTDGALSFTLRPTIPYEQDYMYSETDGKSKTGTVTSSVTEDGVGYIELAGKMGYYDIDFLGIYKVYTDGKVEASTVENNYADITGKEHSDIDGTIVVNNATKAYIVVTLGTDYQLKTETFKGTLDKRPTMSTGLNFTRDKVEGEIHAIDTKFTDNSYEEAYNLLKKAHVDDHYGLFGRVSADLNCSESDFNLPTDVLVENYKSNGYGNYLETLLFQYGRYLLIASSRTGTLPANLQGVWNTYNTAPWGSGYWHNINVQMNYWPAFSTNLSETFEAYVDYNNAYMAEAETYATKYIKENHSDKLGLDGGNGWVIGTGQHQYNINGDRSAGNLGFTTQLFWDYYQFTKNPAILRHVYDVLVNAARYITKCVELDEDGNYLVSYCDSPEVHVNGVWYYTKGTTYAQTFAYLNNYNALEAAKALGINLADSSLLSSEEYSILKTVMEQIDKYDPIHVGLSGQIKEFREEDYYGSVGDDPNHRHVSQLVGLYPGNIINSTTPAWLDAAKVTLENRQGGNSTGGWVYAHKSGLYARTKCGDRAHEMVKGLITDCAFPNLFTKLWDIFQIDASFGITAGMAEMLLQSHEGYIEPLAAIPDEWSTGSYTGLMARGNFEVSAVWENGVAKTFNIKSNGGEPVSVYYPTITNANVVRSSDGNSVHYTVSGKNLITFDTEASETYIISGFTPINKLDAPDALNYSREEKLGDFNFAWSPIADAVSYNIYVAVENAPTYDLINNITDTSLTYAPEENLANSRMTFAVTAISNDGTESDRTLAYYNPQDTSATVLGVEAEILESGELQITVEANANTAKYRLYEKNSSSAGYILVSESQTPNFFIANFDALKDYAVSAVSYYQDEESELFMISSIKGSETLITAYGNIEAKYASALDYPFAIFKDGTFIGAYTTWKDAASAAANQIKGNGAKGQTVNILLRRDYENTEGAPDTITDAGGSIVIDIGSHIITNSSNLFHLVSNLTSGALVNETNIVIKNGTLLAKTHALFSFLYVNNTAVSAKIFNVSVDNVDIGYASGTNTNVPLFRTVNETRENGGETVNFKFFNCDFDFVTNAPSGKVLSIFNLYDAKNLVNVNAEIYAGTFKFNTLDTSSIKLYVLNNGNDTVKYLPDSNEKYTTLEMNSGAAIVSYEYETENGIRYFCKVSTDGTKDYYELISLETEYGTIGKSTASVLDYPFAVFKEDRTFVGAYATWKEASQAAINEVAGNGVNGKTVNILLRRDYANTAAPNDTFTDAAGTIVVDLGSHTITNSANLFHLVSNLTSGALVETTNLIIKNGKLLTNTHSVFSFVYVNNIAVSKKVFNVTVDNVTLGYATNSNSTEPLFRIIHNNRQNGGGTVNFIFNNCDFDFASNAPAGKTQKIFNFYDPSNVVNVNAEIVGGTFKFYTFDTSILKLNVFNDGNDSVIYSKENEGNYSCLIIKKELSAPTDKFALVNGYAVFVKIYEIGDEVIYRLMPKEIADINFVPKMSLTLDRDLILNVYVPQKTYLNGFILDGKAQSEYNVKTVTLEGENYYLVSIPLSAKEAAREITLKVNLTVGEKTATGTFTFSVIKYAEKVLSGGAETEKILVKDVLSYVRSAYAYFKTNDAEAIAKINAILGDTYDENNAPTIDGSATAETNGLKSATFVLDGTPAMRFYLADGADASKYEFFIDGTRVKTETSEDGKYIDIDVYAYALCETVAYTVDGTEAGSFHINAYYEWSKTQNNDNLTNLVARFWKYCQSARDYKNSVVPE
ncbi:MAG: glycoside hydrolase N-terminal domain-containing protein [Clostridia bacterium]|nr:glycoside hydrolase N-terminal domain-containing protein [Clostridia bacterium]